MPQIINTNLASLTAQRNLNKSQSAGETAMQRLSSGLRINSAKDDAAGMAISTRFDSQVRGLAVGIRNANDGISLAQTAEGGLDSITSNLQRMRELAVQSANATNSSIDRQSLNEEVQQLKEEIERISNETNFNGVKLLNGDFMGATFQVGANAGETISVSIGKATVDSLGVSEAGGISALGTNTPLKNGDLIINGVKVGATRAGDDTASTSNPSASAIAKAAAINRVADQTGVTAVVDKNDIGGSAMTPAATSGGSITLNGTSIAIDTTSDPATTRASVVAAINAQAELTGVTAVDSGDDKAGVTLVAADGRNIELDFGNGTLTSANTGLAQAGTYEGGFTLVADSSVKEINISGSSDLANSGLAAGSYKTGEATVASSSRSAEAASAVNVTASDMNTATGAVNYSVTNGTFDYELRDAAGNVVSSGAMTVDDDLAGANLAANMNTLAGSVIADLRTAIDGDTGLTTTAADINAVVSPASGADGTITWSLGGDLKGYSLSFSNFAGGPDANATADLQAMLGGGGKVISGVDNLNSGDLVINGSQISAAKASDDTASYTGAASSSKEASGISMAAAINRASGETGVTATVNATTVEGTTTTPGTAADTAALWLNGIEINLTVQTSAEDSRLHALAQINAVSGQTGVVATDNGEGITLTAADGRNIVTAFDTNEANTGSGNAVAASNFGLSSSIASSDISDGAVDKAARLANANTAANTTYSTVTLTSAGAMTIEAGSNGTAGLAGLGLETGTYGGAANGQYLKDVDISTVEGANKALQAVDNALKQVNSARSELGAIQNRFESTIMNQQITSENLTAANSRIRDADFAAETAEMSRTQVLQQAGISILAQANGQPQQILQLLQG